MSGHEPIIWSVSTGDFAENGDARYTLDGIKTIGAKAARLIEAAPHLLAVAKELEESASYWSEYDVPLGIVDRLRAAIAKAEPTGSTP